MKDKNSLAQLIENSKRIVFFGGAGVSVPSGIPDFRSSGGVYSSDYNNIPPETIVSHSFFERYPADFYKFYKERMVFPNAQPNAAHIALAKLEQEGKLLSVVTQNIDGLHQAAGSKRVWELHGSVHRNYCTHCGKKFSLDYVLACDGVPTCDECGAVVRPDVVLYEEQLDMSVLGGAVADIEQCDLLIIGGTSMSVYPAAGLINYRPANAKLAVINRTPTPADSAADAVEAGDIAEFFKTIRK